MLLGWLAWVSGLALACAHVPTGDLVADLVSEAIRARGGPLPAFMRESEVTVHRGLPGSWQWRISLRGAGSVQLTLLTSGEDQHWETDGEEARTYLGGAVVSREPLAQSEFSSMARWVQLIHLDALADASRFDWNRIPAAALPDEFSRGLTVRCVRTDCGTYTLFFDRSLRLLSAEGPLTIPGVGDARVRARFGDFRRTDGLVLPFEAVYTSDGLPLLDDRVVEFEKKRVE